MRTASFLVLALALTFASSDRGDAQPKGKQLTPLDFYAQFRATIPTGFPAPAPIPRRATSLPPASRSW